MRYRIDDGVVEYFKEMYDHVVYADDASHAYELYEKMIGTVATSPVVCIVRSSSEPKVSRMTRKEFLSGRWNRVNLVDSKFETISIVEADNIYEISVLSGSKYKTDTLVDELIMRILEVPTYQYYSGVTNPADGEQLKLEGYLTYEPEALGSMEEANDIENIGRVYKSAFSLSTQGAIFRTSDTPLVRKIPISVLEIVE